MNSLIATPATARNRTLDFKLLLGSGLVIALGLGKGFEFTLVGRLFVTEIILLALLPYLLTHERPHPATEQFHKAILILGGLWLWSQGLTDFIRQTPFEDWTRGNSKIAFMLLNYIALRRLLNSDRRLLLFAVGMAVGSAISIQGEGWELETAWKFGLGLVYLTLLLVGASMGPLRRLTWLPSILLIGVSAQAASLGSRSFAGECILAAGILMLGLTLDLIGAQTRWGRILGFCCVGLVAFGGYKGFGYLSDAGVFGEKVQTKYRQQIKTGDGNLLLGGRGESRTSLIAIGRSPILGHGSWAKDAELRAQHDQRYAIANNRRYVSQSTLIPSHSFFFGAWVEAGIIGAVFWVFVYGLALWTIFKLMAWTQPLGPLAAFTACSLLWDIPFSPFGATIRLNIAAVIDQRKNYRPLKTFIFGLNVIRNTFKLDICIES